MRISTIIIALLALAGIVVVTISPDISRAVYDMMTAKPFQKFLFTAIALGIILGILTNRRPPQI